MFLSDPHSQYEAEEWGKAAETKAKPTQSLYLSSLFFKLQEAGDNLAHF